MDALVRRLIVLGKSAYYKDVALTKAAMQGMDIAYIFSQMERNEEVLRYILMQGPERCKEQGLDYDKLSITVDALKEALNADSK
jgi:hypothetical protein